MKGVQSPSPQVSELKQHFQNYFELLLGSERAKLLQSIASSEKPSPEYWTSRIDLRIEYLKGAVRMGRLLCVISPEEAKMKHEILMSERDSLLACCAERPGNR